MSAINTKVLYVFSRLRDIYESKYYENELKSKSGNDNIIFIIVKAMEIVEGMKNLNSDDKFTLVVLSVGMLIDNMRYLSNKQKEHYKSILPNTIEGIIKMSKKKLLKKGDNKYTIEIDKLVLNIYILIKNNIMNSKMITSKTIANDIFMIALNVFNILEEYPSLTSKEREEVIIKSLKSIAENITSIIPDIDDDMIDSIYRTIKLLPDYIKILQWMSENVFDINKVKNLCCGFIKKYKK